MILKTSLHIARSDIRVSHRPQAICHIDVSVAVFRREVEILRMGHAKRP